MNGQRGASAEELIQAYFDGELPPEGQAVLRQWLAAAPANMDLFVRQLETHAALWERFATAAGEQAARESGEWPPDSVRRRLSSRRSRLRVTASRRKSRRRFGGLPLVAAAAAALLVAGIFWALREQGPNVPAGAAMASLETPASVRRSGRLAVARAGTALLPGDRIETASGQTVGLVYTGEKTRVRLEESSRLDVLGATGGKRLHLETGRLAASVAPQPKGLPMAVTTPQARAEVFGTDFALAAAGSATRLDVEKGLVLLTRLSDGRKVEVAAGQYAVAASGVELAALPLGGKEAPAPTSGRASPNWFGYKAGMVLGETLLDDDFDGTLDKWDVLVGTTGVPASVSREAAPYATLARDVRHVEDPVRPDKVRVIGSCLILDPQNEAGRFVAIRSKAPIRADKFLIELYCAYSQRDPAVPMRMTIYNEGIEIAEKGIVVLNGDGNNSQGLSSNMATNRWVFIAERETPDGKMWKRIGYNPWSVLISVCRVRADEPRVMLGVQGTGGCLHIDRIVVREMLKEGHAP